jgi:predicted CopG family antitoxin
LYTVARKTVKVHDDRHQRLRERKLVDSESFDSVIERLLDATEDDAPVESDT